MNDCLLGELDETYVTGFFDEWFRIYGEMQDMIELKCSTIGCIMLDGLAAINEDLFNMMPVSFEMLKKVFILWPTDIIYYFLTGISEKICTCLDFGILL